MNKTITTRIAPSPTGPLHIGTARTALFNYLFAKHNKGKFILRIEDTDKSRSKKHFEKEILNTLNKLGLKPDEIFYQSKRINIYRKYLEKLVSQGNAYVSKETAKDSPEKKVEVIRFKNRNERIVYKDYLRGKLEADISDLGDFVIAKSFDEPLYNFAVVVDDLQMGVTHIIRGDDHISNTPRQVAIQKVLGVESPVYVHIPLIHSEFGKLSKRKDADSIQKYLDNGFLESAIINYLALLGWSPKNSNKEIFSLEELVGGFSLDGLQKGKAVFNIKKLIWFNKIYIKNLSLKDIAAINKCKLFKRFFLKTFNKRKTKAILEDIRERSDTLSDGSKLISEGHYDFFFKDLSLLKDLLLYDGLSAEVTENHLNFVYETFNKISSNDWNKKMLKDAILEYANMHGRREVLWPLRYALSAKEKSPDAFLIADVIGKNTTLKRILNAINLLKNN